MKPMFDVFQFGLYYECCKMSNFSIPPHSPRLIMGEITWLAYKARDKQNMSTHRFVTFRKFQLPEKDCLSLAALQSCGILWQCRGLLRTVSDLVWPENERRSLFPAWMGGRQSCAVSSLHRKRLRSNCDKTVCWWHQPPRSAKFNILKDQHESFIRLSRWLKYLFANYLQNVSLI